MATTIMVKNMVCNRCVMAVESILNSLEVPYQKVVVGEIELSSELPENTKSKLAERLAVIGLELIDNRITALIEKVKTLVIRKARNEVSKNEKAAKLSNYLSENLHLEYTYLSNLFSSVEGRTIENYFLDQRIEKVKELLVYDEMSISEIAFELDFSSVAHLSNQFKKITGLTPSHFKQIGQTKRAAIDRV